MNLAIILLSVVGIALSLYALYVKHNLSKNKSYRAVCDFNDKVSCTKAMGSRYGSLFTIPNSAFGVLFYALILLLGFFDEMKAVFGLSLLAVVGSLFLAYVSFFKLRIACPVCTIIYILNVLLLALSWQI